MKVLVAVMLVLSLVALAVDNPETYASLIPTVEGDTFGNGGDEFENLEAIRKLCEAARSNDEFAPLNRDLYLRYCDQSEVGRE